MKKIGIVTIHSDLNYGAFLQAFALAKFLRSRRYDAEIIDYRKIPNHPRKYPFPINIFYKIFNFPRLYRYRNFIKPVVSKRRYNSVSEIEHGFNENYDVLIAGSDQIWNPDCGGLNKLNPVYFLTFASSSEYKKISYASSIGSYVYSKDEQQLVASWLSDFCHISTREMEGAKQLESFINEKVEVVLDPTLLLNHSDWIQFASRVHIKDNYVLVYYIDELEEVVSYARKVADKLNIKVALISNMAKKPKGVDILVHHCGPAQFLWLFDHASYICTNSFHGTAFALNFNKNFISVIKRNSPQRQRTLLKNVGLESRLLTNIDQLDNIELNINFSYANTQLCGLREKSISYLIDSIER